MLVDQPVPLRKSAYALVQWYVATREPKAGPTHADALQVAVGGLRDTLQETFHDTEVHNLDRIPKMHRLEHVARSVLLYGPYTFLTTESSESAHKQLKRMFRTCVTLLHVVLLPSCTPWVTCGLCPLFFVLCLRIAFHVHRGLRVSCAPSLYWGDAWVHVRVHSISLLLYLMPFRSNKHAVPAMFARRLTRKHKVTRLTLRLAMEENTALALAPADPEKHDLLFQLGGDGCPVALADLSNYLPSTPWEGVDTVTPKVVEATLRRRILQLTNNRSDRFDRGSLRVHPFAVARESGKRVRIQARRSYYGHGERYDWVRSRGEGDGEWWYGRLSLLVSATVLGAKHEFAVLHWLTAAELPREHVIGARHWKFWTRKPQVELVRTIWRRAFFVTSPKLGAGAVIFLQLPYGPTLLPPEEEPSDVED